MNETDSTQSTQGWDTYWQGANKAGVVAAGGPSHPGFLSFWSLALTEFAAFKPDGKVLDIGTGGGAIIEHISRVPNAKMENVACVDVSKAAIESINKRFPAVTAVTADANNIPLETGDYDLITSQFGIEYAGLSAVDEAIRLLAPGGHFLFLMHIHSGAPYRDSSSAIDALDRTIQSNFVRLAHDFFDAGFAAVRGADRSPYEEAGKKLDPAVRELEAILSEHGEHVADDTIIYLHSNVQKIHVGIQKYDPSEVLPWLESMERELTKHKERMISMQESALDKPSFEQLCENLTGKGFAVERAEPLVLESEGLPFAWVLQAAGPAK